METTAETQDTPESIQQEISKLKRKEAELTKKADTISRIKSEPKRAMALEDLKEDLQKLHKDIQALNYSKQLNDMSEGIVLIAERIAGLDKKLDEQLAERQPPFESFEQAKSHLPPVQPFVDTETDEEDEKPRGIRGIFGILPDDKKIDSMTIAKEPIITSIADQVALLRRKVAYMAILGAVFFIATFLLLGVNAYLAVVTVMIAAFFIFKFQAAFGKMTVINRQLMQQANKARLIAAEKAAAEAAKPQIGPDGNEIPKTHWERE